MTYGNETITEPHTMAMTMNNPALVEVLAQPRALDQNHQVVSGA
jgi:hypothetical protein